MLLALPALAFTLAAAVAADWPQWQGPDRTGISKETGLLKTWPKDGPPLAWKVKGLGGGYTTPSVAQGRIYGMSYKGNEEVVWALNEADGKELWNTKIAAKGQAGYNEGSRCSPTVDGDRVYVLGISSDVVCLDAASGKILWQKNLKKDYAGKMMSGWGYSESPLVDGDKLIVTPGGKDASLVALNKKDGELLWKAQVPQGDGAGYSSVIAADVQGTRQYIQFMGRGVVGIAAADGKFLWRYDKPHNTTANISTPIYHDGHVFAGSGYGTGGGLAKLTKQATGDFKADEVYFTKQMQNHHGGMVLVDGHIYGNNQGQLACINFLTGEVKWNERKPGKGSIAFADGHIYYRNEGGPIVLVEANPKEYVEKGRFTQPDRSGKSAWPHPVIANGKLYILDQDLLLCYDIKQK
ncbi:MAG: PQQ-like beta-propeller repeat protein [Planctomycetia bacterium]|nr:PQQ-like beta-propeller repeat protein [Planctomycetia bacterium]